MNHELSIDLIMFGLSDSFAQFVLNYRMKIESSILELINMLKAIKPSLKKEGKAMMLMDTSGSKKSSKNKKKKVRETTLKGTCFHFSKSGH